MEHDRIDIREKNIKNRYETLFHNTRNLGIITTVLAGALVSIGSYGFFKDITNVKSLSEYFIEHYWDIAYMLGGTTVLFVSDLVNDLVNELAAEKAINEIAKEEKYGRSPLTKDIN